MHFKSLQNPHIEGLTILGGEPFEPFNQAELVNLLHIVKQEFSEKNILCFTGFVYDKDLLKGQRKHTNATDEMLSYIMNKTAQKAVLFLHN
ncbi:4Fe-4S cluster-binding domain-containing protein [Bulleidia sp. HCP3S3_G12]|uniref:4Fe-4S cluster-binding domain-containing protein n=1 Tax=Bulleidia sp. HCP3S3_G12 TaxID=3438916 RepID=UPI003F8C57FF